MAQDHVFAPTTNHCAITAPRQRHIKLQLQPGCPVNEHCQTYMSDPRAIRKFISRRGKILRSNWRTRPETFTRTLFIAVPYPSVLRRHRCQFISYTPDRLSWKLSRHICIKNFIIMTSRWYVLLWSRQGNYSTGPKFSKPKRKQNNSGPNHFTFYFIVVYLNLWATDHSRF